MAYESCSILRGSYNNQQRRLAFRSLTGSANGHAVICEVLRYCYDCITDLPDNDRKTALTEHLVTAFLMAKSMDRRLHYYWETYQDQTGGHARHIPRIPDSVKRRRMRQARWPM